MADTPRTLAFLLAFLFQDGQTAGSITPQDVRDMIVSWGYRTAPSVMEYGAVGDGVTDDTTAFSNALAANKNVVVPALKFAVGNVIVTSGNSLIGMSSVGAAYPGSAASEAGTTATRPVIQAISGAARLFNVDNAYSYTISGLLLDGLNNTPNGIEQPTFGATSAGTIRDCVLINFNVAANINYGILHAYESSFGNNVTGVSNVVDGMIANNDFAGNSHHSMILGSGAGSLTVVGNRFEWSGFAGISVGDGVSLANGASRVTITGNWFDRNGWAGICVEPGSDVVITGNAFMRNGRVDTGLWAQAHIYLWGACRVAISGNTTSIGVDDNGTGTLTPRYAIAFDSPPGSAIAIGGNQLTGYTTAVTSGTVPTDTTTTATAHVTSGSLVITTLSTTATACVGQRVTGAGIPIGNTIGSIDSATQITMKGAVATATSTVVAITFKADYSGLSGNVV